MLSVLTGRQMWILGLALVAAFAVAVPAAAQSTGMVKGKVVDGKDQPVENARVVIEFEGGVSRRHEVTTNRRGEFIQIGLPPGSYKVTAEKQGLGAQTFSARVPLGDAAEVNFKLVPGGSGVTMTKEDAARTEALKATFDQGVAASRAGDHDGAIAKFMEAAEQLTETKDGKKIERCYDCWYNIGYAYAQKKDYEQSEAAFKKALEIRSDYVDAYNGLATVYNAQKKFAEAAEASQKAVELAAAAGGGTEGGAGGNVDALYNQGVINWNAGKIAEAQKCFEDALKVNPNHADSHYQLGMAHLNQGRIAEALASFETYLKLAPDGQYGTQAKGIIATLKK